MDIDKLQHAIALATEAHKDQVDQVGNPYIHHPIRVMEAVYAAGYDDVHQMAAVLHDTVEDTNVTLGMIRDYFGDDVAVAVDHLTRRKNTENTETYHSFILRARVNPVARVVKRFDVLDNLGRIDGLELVNPEKAGRLHKRYKSALRALEDK